MITTQQRTSETGELRLVFGPMLVSLIAAMKYVMTVATRISLS